MPVTSDLNSRDRSDLPDPRRPRWGALLALTLIPLAVACGKMPDPGVAYDPGLELSSDDGSVDEDANLVDKAAINVSSELARKIAAAAPKSSTGLPLWESRPGARVALYLDFDGGRYDSADYRGIDRDGNRASFGTDEQVAIIRAALEVVEGYKGFNVNVTTSEAAMRKAPKWGWILITDDEGTSGEAYIGSIARSSPCSGSSCYPKGFAGSEAVLAPPSAQRGYLLIHELGHQFGLNHSGLYKNGQFYEWSELKQSRTGDWLGGRSSYFYDYTWIKSQTENSTAWQDPQAILTSVAGTVNDGDPTDACPNDPNKTSPGLCGCGVPEGTCSGTATLTVTKPTFAVNEAIVVNYKNLPGGSRDWIGLFAANASNSTYLQYKYTGTSATGSLTFTGLGAGDYQARLFYNDTYTLVTSVSFKVGATPVDGCPNDPAKTAPGLCGCGVPEGTCAPSVKTSKATFSTNEPIVVTYANLPGSATDWIGIYAAGTANTAYLQYFYTGGKKTGSMTFSARAAGKYEARLFLNDSYNLAAKAAFSVGP